MSKTKPKWWQYVLLVLLLPLVLLGYVISIAVDAVVTILCYWGIIDI